MKKLRSNALTWQQVDDEIICLDLVASRYLAINESGAALWPMLIDGAEVDDLVRTLMKTFEIDRAAAQQDVDAFIGMLQERSLLEST